MDRFKSPRVFFESFFPVISVRAALSRFGWGTRHGEAVDLRIFPPCESSAAVT